MSLGFVYIPFWRSGGWEDIQYRTQLYLAPLSSEPVDLGIYLYENGGSVWAGKTFNFEIDQHVSQVTTNRDGMFQIRINPFQVVRVEINVLDHDYGTGEIHLLSGTQPVPLLARAELEAFAKEASSGGFEMTTSEITITAGTPQMLEPGK